MPVYTLAECYQIQKENQKIKPADRELWKKVIGICESSNKTLRAKVYENLGGRWKLVEFNMLNSIDEDPNEILDYGPVSGTRHSKRWLERIKEYDPQTYEKIVNWD